ncbi:MAG TPA: penicillin-binding protein activator, partial [Thermoanaerobaculia bacterium]|nr:penicillin-binding protein activator [Thermoanaerobaculia bacterium]
MITDVYTRPPALLVIACLAVVGTTLGSCRKSDLAQEPRARVKDVSIGVVVPLTGEVATYGTAILNGVRLAAEELNSSSGIHFVLKIEDDQANPRVGVAAARKLITIDRTPAVIGAVASSVTLSIAPIAEQSGVVLLSPASSSPKLTHAGAYIFRNYPSDTLEGDLAAAFALKRGWRRASVVVMNNDYGVGLQEVFVASYRSGGGVILTNDTFNEGTADFRAMLVRLGRDKPDVIFSVGYGRELGTLARQARALGIRAQLLSTVNFHCCPRQLGSTGMPRMNSG